MGDPIASALTDMGLGVRVYTPVGALIPGMAYLVRRLLENSANDSFLRRRFQERREADALLAPPVSLSLSPATPPSPSPLPFANEPPTDFSRAAAREAMRGALDRARAGLDRAWPLVIGGRPVETERTMVSSPAILPADRARGLGDAGTRRPGWPPPSGRWPRGGGSRSTPAPIS
jgi:RHH-type proline utilization regulon transcriptional repressor/proline dehydrogenase/delta 1-pyrroline-5-carboxylate dehydrogenase